MSTSIQVLLWMSLALSCLSHPGSKTTSLPTTSTLKTPTSPTEAVKSKNNDSSAETESHESEETGIAHIIKHSKLFTEFVSFAVNPVKSMELVDSVRTSVLGDQPAASSEEQKTPANKTADNNASSHSVADHVQSSPLLQELFIEMTKINSPGFVVSFDYLNVTAKSSDGEMTLRKPVRMWGILPDELNNKTVYFLADHYRAASYDAETRTSAKEQIEDFQLWKNETLTSADFSDDKLGEGTLASLIGGGG